VDVHKNQQSANRIITVKDMPAADSGEDAARTLPREGQPGPLHCAMRPRKRAGPRRPQQRAEVEAVVNRLDALWRERLTVRAAIRNPYVVRPPSNK